jgi:hypothetical protein
VNLLAPPLDANEVRLALLRFAEDGWLQLRNVPDFLGRRWREFSAPDNLLWKRGILLVEGPPGHMNTFEPEIARTKLISLFTIHEAEAAAAEHPTGAAPKVSRGRPPREGPRIVAEMRKMDRLQLKVMKGVEMETTFKASRETCEKARKEVLSEFVGK